VGAPRPGLVAALDTPNLRRLAVLAAIVGALLGLETLALHLATDPLADVHAYYDAGSRLNAGLPLYEQPASTNDAAFYRYPPLLAIAFRPLALLPFPAAAAIWEVLLVAALLLTIRRLGSGRVTWLVLAMLALPTVWSLVIGQAQVAVTLLLAVGTPWAVALAANLKLFPLLVAIWWLGRRDSRSLARLAGGLIALGLVQLVLEPTGSFAYLAFLARDQVGDVNNVGPFAISPWMWAISLAVVAVIAFRAAPTRWGWPAAVVLSVLANPRLLVYQLSSLIAGLRESDAAPVGRSATRATMARSADGSTTPPVARAVGGPS
jgi:hypothetical protein